MRKERVVCGCNEDGHGEGHAIKSSKINVTERVPNPFLQILIPTLSIFTMLAVRFLSLIYFFHVKFSNLVASFFSWFKDGIRI